MATKRRRVWVNFYSGGTGFTLPSRAKAKETRALFVEVAVPMVERLPGDVVLSREEVAALKKLAERKGKSEEPVAWAYGLAPKPDCRNCQGTGVYTWQDGHNGDDHESDCDCTRAVSLTVGQALAPFRGRR